MKIAYKLKSHTFFIAITVSLIFVVGCKSSSTTTSDDPNSGSIAGVWSLKSIQCLAVPSEDFPCWKSFLVPLGEINMQSNSTSVLTILDDGTYSGDLIPKIDTLPQSIFACAQVNSTSKQHIDGTYSASEGLIILHVVNYLVNGQKQFDQNDEVVVDGTYTITNTTLTVTFNLAQGERWRVNFTK